MHIIGSTLQWLAAVPAVGDEYRERGPPMPRVQRGSRPSDSALRWKIASQHAMATIDPWHEYGVEALPLERATKREWTGDYWRSDEVLVKVERHPFTRGAMRQCHRLKLRVGKSSTG